MSEPVRRGPGKQRTIVIDSGVQLAARAFTLGCSFLVLKITTVELGAEGFGVYTPAIAFVGIATVVTGLGLPAVLARDLAKQDVDADLFALSLTLRAAMATAAIPVVIGAAWLLYGSGPLSSAVAILAPMMVLVGLRETAAAALLGSGLPSRKALLDVLTALVSVAAVVVASAVTTTTSGFLMALPVGAAASLVAASVVARPIASTLRVRTAGSSAFFGLVLQSAPFFKIEAVNRLYVSADTLILAAYRPEREVGSYGLAYAAMSIVMTLPSVVVPVVLPHLVREKGRSRKMLVEGLMQVLLVAALPLVFLGPILSRRVVEVMSTPNFAGASWPLSVLLVAAAVSFVNAGLGVALFAEDDERFLVRSTVIVAVSNIGLNLVLVRAHGASGAAVAMVITEVLAMTLLAWRYVDITGHRPVRSVALARGLLCAAVSSAAGGMVLPFLNTNVLVEVAIVLAVAMSIYGTALRFCGFRPGALMNVSSTE